MIGLAIRGQDVIDGWIRAARAVAANGFANDHVTIVAESEWPESAVSLRALDAAANLAGAERPSAVANVLCPSLLLVAAGTSADKIVRAWEYYGRGRQRGIHFSGWRDTYFERLTGHRALSSGNYESIGENRLLHIIEKIRQWDKNITSSLYAHTNLPGDTLRPRGAPCLQYVQFRVFDDTKIGITAVYRSHDYLSKALGNMIGLQRLARFVAQETGREFGRVSVISLAPIAEGGKGALRRYADGVAGVH
jgi:hypothetical protein